jgi:hypothetical protein
VVRGDITVGRQFTVFYLKDGRVCAVDSVLDRAMRTIGGDV